MILPKNGQKLPQMSNLGFFRVFWPKQGILGHLGEKKMGKILADNKQFGTKIIEIDQEFNFVEFFKEIGAFYQFLTRLWGTTLHKDFFFFLLFRTF